MFSIICGYEVGGTAGPIAVRIPYAPVSHTVVPVSCHGNYRVKLSSHHPCGTNMFPHIGKILTNRRFCLDCLSADSTPAITYQNSID